MAHRYWIVLLASGCADFAGIGNPRLEQPDAPQPCVIGGLDLCLFARPQAPLMIDSDLQIDTTVDCNLVVYAPPAPSVCVIYASEIRVNAKLRAIGSRALVLAATTLLEVRGTIDVSSYRAMGGTGAAANDSSCMDHGSASYGGGAGGSFAGRGGNGGNGGNTTGGTGHVAHPAIAAPAHVRGGCPGGPYSTSDSGGAVWLAAGELIRLTPSARLTANGAGGGDGFGFAGSGDGGSGGGGSGGMLRLAALRLELAGIFAANGGGGSEGIDSNDNPAVPGSDGLVGTERAPGGGGVSLGGDGGAGGAGSTPDGVVGVSTTSLNASGGGGGGGAGFVQLISGSIDNAAIISPSPIMSASP